MNDAPKTDDENHGAAETAEPGAIALKPGEDGLIDSEALLQGRREVFIHHQGQMYRLQATRGGKLILTK